MEGRRKGEEERGRRGGGGEVEGRRKGESGNEARLGI